MMFSTVAPTQQASRVIKWQKIIGWKHAEITAYVDVNSLTRDTKDGKDIASGIILYHRSQPVEIDLSLEKKSIVTGFARYFLIDCDRMLMLPVVDYYFNLPKLPTVKDPLVTAIDYTEKQQEPAEISKDNVVYKTLCPKYI